MWEAGEMLSGQPSSCPESRRSPANFALYRPGHPIEDSMWLATPFAIVLLGFSLISGVTVAGLTWSAHRGSWHRAAQVALATFAMSALWWTAVAVRVPFAWSYVGSTFGSLIATAGIPGGAASLWIRRGAVHGSERNLAGALVVAALLWLPLAFVFAIGAACNLDAACY